MTQGFKAGKKDKDDGISLRELILIFVKWWNYLTSKWLIVFAFGLLGAILGFGYAYYKKSIYTATTTFVLETGEANGGLNQYAGLASMVGIDLGGGGGLFQGDNILELYKSRRMIEKTLLTEVKHDGKVELLVDRYVKINELRKSWAKNLSLKNIKFSKWDGIEPIKVKRLKDSILSLIVIDINRNYLIVSKPDKNLGLIQVQVKSQDDFFAKYFNELIVANVNEFYIQTKTKRSLDNIAILQGKTDSVRKVMYGAISSAVSVADATPNINPTREIGRMAPIRKSEFNAETNKQVLSELVKNLEMSKIAYVKETPLIQVIDGPIFPLEKTRLGKIKSAFVGGMLFVFLITLALIFRQMIKELFSNE